MTKSCPSPERWKEHLETGLSVDEQAALTEHLDSCPACRKTLESLAAGSDSLLDIARQAGEVTDATRTSLHEVMKRFRAPVGATQAEPGTGDDSLSFLTPSEKPGVLGRLGHYEVREVLGKGGFGIVLKGFDERLHRVVAIKVLSPAYAANGAARARFIREARSAAAVKNEHVVAIYDVQDKAEPPYLVMELIDGISLQDKIDRKGPLSLKEILRIGMQMAEGLAAAHKQGLVHRDIKPSNILLENGVERVKISDFGLARAVDDASVTQSGTVAGTPMYMSPEQAEGMPIDHRSDLFSLGTVLYAMCTGHPPFRASGTHAVLKRVIDAAPRPIREINNEIPDWLCEIVAKLHAKKPEDRFQTAKEVAELLGQRLADVQAGRAIPGEPSRVSDRSEPAANIAPTPITEGDIAAARALVQRRLRMASHGLLLCAVLSILMGIGLTVWLAVVSGEIRQSRFAEFAVFAGALWVHGLVFATVAFLLRRKRGTEFGLIALTIAGIIAPIILGLNVFTETQHWPVLIPLALGLPLALWTIWLLFRDDDAICRLFLERRLQKTPAGSVNLTANAAPTPVARGPRRKRAVLGVALLLAMALLVVGLMLSSSGDDTELNWKCFGLVFGGGGVLVTVALLLGNRAVKALWVVSILGLFLSASIFLFRPFPSEFELDLLLWLLVTGLLGFLVFGFLLVLSWAKRSPDAPRPARSPVFVGLLVALTWGAILFYVPGGLILHGNGEAVVGLAYGSNSLRYQVEKDGRIVAVLDRYPPRVPLGRLPDGNPVIFGAKGDNWASHVRLRAGKYQLRPLYNFAWVGSDRKVDRVLLTSQDWDLSFHGTEADPTGIIGLSVAPGQVVTLKQSLARAGDAGACDFHINAALEGDVVLLADGVPITREPLQSLVPTQFGSATKIWTTGHSVAPGTYRLQAYLKPRDTSTLTPLDVDKEEVTIRKGETTVVKVGFTDTNGTPAGAAWVQLFNRKDLTGWKTSAPQPGDKWVVKDGALTCSGPLSHLFFQKSDKLDLPKGLNWDATSLLQLRNYHLRIEAKINRQGTSGVFFSGQAHGNLGPKGEVFPGQYCAVISSNPDQLNKTGTLIGYFTEKLAPVTETLTRPDEWFTLDILQQEDRLRISVAGKQVADVRTELVWPLTQLALQHFGPETQVQFRKIEIRPLPPEDDLDRLQGTWVAISAEENGQRLPADLVRHARVSFQGNKVRVVNPGGKTDEGEFKLDTAAKPFKAFDIIGGKEQRPRSAIYGFSHGFDPGSDGHILVLCLGEDRPSEFKSKAGTSRLRMSYKRVLSPEPGWVQLFDGKGFSEKPAPWLILGTQPGNWGVYDGIMMGTGGPRPIITRDRTFRDFHLRMEAEINDGADAGLFFRLDEPVPSKTHDYFHGYCVTLRGPGATLTTPGVADTFIGIKGLKAAPPIEKDIPRLLPRRWFTLEVIATKNHFVVKLGGKIAADVTDPDNKHTSGYFGLRLGNANTVLRVRKFEVKELPPVNRFINGLGMEFALVPKGKAWLGGGAGKAPDKVVDFKEDFYLGVHEVTQEEWESVTGKNPSYYSRSGGGKVFTGNLRDEYVKLLPVENVSWQDCQDFVARLNEKLKEQGWKYRLPTEQEWEYACRGGPMTSKQDAGFDFYVETASARLDPQQANFIDTELGRPNKVGSYPPNRLGLHDMHGNVEEWCEDSSPEFMGIPQRVYRDGYFNGPDQACKASYRTAVSMHSRSNTRGLRLARVPVVSGEVKAPSRQVPGWGDFINPDGTSDVRTEEAGAVTITVKAGDRTFYAAQPAKVIPRLVQEVEGDFTAELKLPPPADGTACFGVWNNDHDLLALIYNQAKDQASLTTLRFLDGPGSASGPTIMAPWKPQFVHLKIERRGKAFTTSWSKDGRDMVQGKEMVLESWPAKLQIGVAVTHRGPEEVRVRFEKIEIKKK